METESSTGVIINGERFSFSDSVAYIMASDATRSFADDLPEGGVDRRPSHDGGRLEEAVRFTPIATVLGELEAKIGYEEGVEWLTTPNSEGLRPLDVMETDEWPLILEHIRKEDFPAEF